MNLKDAIDSISAESTEYNAAKYQSWGGYVHKTTNGLSTADVENGKHKLIFVQRDGDQYVYTYGGTSNPAYAYTGYIERDSPVPRGRVRRSPARRSPSTRTSCPRAWAATGSLARSKSSRLAATDPASGNSKGTSSWQ